MTKKDYQLLARVLSGFEELIGRRELVSDLADALALDNARFNRELFMEECDVK